MSAPTGRDYAGAALRYAGHREYRTAAGVYTNRQRFGARFGWNGVAWCQIFAWCAADDIGAGALVPRTASCRQAVKWFKSRKQWFSKPKIGDQVFFGHPAHHVGIVTAVSGASVAYVSGNANDGTAPAGTGNAVTVRTAPLSDPTILGYGRPRWAPEPPPQPPADPVPVKPRGGGRWIVRRGQTLTGIAAALGVSVSALLAVNADLNTPDPGTRVTIPHTSAPPVSARPTARKPSGKGSGAPHSRPCRRGICLCRAHKSKR